MDTCSNCGAAVRPGAKFCTACGTRLNDVDASDSGSSGWGVSAPVEDNPPATETTVDDVASTRLVDEERSERIPETPSTSTTAWRWGSSETDNPAERIPITQADDDGPANSVAADAVQSSPTAPTSSDTFQWSWGSSSTSETEEAPESSESSTDESLTSQPAGADKPDNDDTPQSAEVVADSFREEDEAGKQEREAELADAAPPYDWRQSVSYSYKEKPPTPGNSGVEVAADAESDASTPAVFADSDGVGTGLTDAADVQARAMALLDELRSLIPALGLSATSGGDTNIAEASGESSNTQDVIADLESARSDITTPDDLRSVLEAAQSRPRDMDVILDLVARAGSLLELLDERDRLAAAIDRAVSSLRS